MYIQPKSLHHCLMQAVCDIIKISESNNFTFTCFYEAEYLALLQFWLEAGHDGLFVFVFLYWWLSSSLLCPLWMICCLFPMSVPEKPLLLHLLCLLLWVALRSVCVTVTRGHKQTKWLLWVIKWWHIQTFIHTVHVQVCHVCVCLKGGDVYIQKSRVNLNNEHMNMLSCARESNCPSLHISYYHIEGPQPLFNYHDYLL